MIPKSDEVYDLRLVAALQEIGRFLAEEISLFLENDGDLHLTDVYMYAEVGFNYAGASIFKDAGDRLMLRFGSSDLTDFLMKLWHAAPHDRKWSVLEYQIVAPDHFEAKFGYDDVENDDSTSIDRRETKVRARFGDKPIDFSDTGEDLDF